jgi:hypothetical protein
MSERNNYIKTYCANCSNHTTERLRNKHIVMCMVHTKLTWDLKIIACKEQKTFERMPE